MEARRLDLTPTKICLFGKRGGFFTYTHLKILRNSCLLLLNFLWLLPYLCFNLGKEHVVVPTNVQWASLSTKVVRASLS